MSFYDAYVLSQLCLDVPLLIQLHSSDKHGVTSKESEYC